MHDIIFGKKHELELNHTHDGAHSIYLNKRQLSQSLFY